MPLLRLLWDRANGRYRDAKTGRFVSQAAIRRTLDRDLAGLNAQAIRLGNELRTNRLSLEGWRQAMRDLIKHAHMGAAAISVGGRAQMTQADWGRVGGTVRQQYGFLEKWVGEIRAGWVLDGRLATRAILYVQRARNTLHGFERDVVAARGFDESRSVLDPKVDPARHCATCVAQALKGWQPIADMIPIGDRDCLSNDLCFVEYRNSSTGRIFASASPAASPVSPPRTPVISGANILAQPSTAYPAARPGEATTLLRYTDSNGRWTPERQQLHDAIIRQQFAGKTPVAKQTVYVMGGGPASGKSVMLNRLELPTNMVRVDPDHIKEKLPEFREGVAAKKSDAASVVHDESSDVASLIAHRAASGQYNVLIDGTGDGSYEHLAAKVAGYRARGGKVVANYVTVDTETAVARARARGDETGRYVPEAYTRAVHRSISGFMPRVIKNGLFDELNVWDTNGPSVKLIAKYAEGRLTILDRPLWERFLAKAI